MTFGNFELDPHSDFFHMDDLRTLREAVRDQLRIQESMERIAGLFSIEFLRKSFFRTF